jgi:hypothetical protein
MNLLLCLLLTAAAGRTIQVRTTDVAPRIDGRIEDVWLQADTVSDFMQSWPDQGEAGSERTEVFVLQDDANLYVAVRGWCEKAPPVGQLYGLEDEITVFIDPMDSRSMAYWFKTYGSGLYHDGLVLDNGANWDWSWEGVWFTEARLYDDRLEVEMRIPFKSIRYREGLSEWGFDVERFIARERERSHIIEVHDEEGGFQVSGFARLQGVAPRASGYYFELLPEGYVRYDQGRDQTKGDVTPFASLNLKWDLTPQTTLNATVLPDFAQIESDPYSFNISRYPVFLAERRPFFVEGNELFRQTSVGGGPFWPLQLFYSRRIGRPVGQEPVPILSGLKLTTRSRDWSFGALGAVTDQLTDTTGSVLEPRRGFAVLSGKTGLPDDSRLGMLFAGTVANGDGYNYTLGADWNHSEGPHRSTVQAALSDHTGTLGWALNSGYNGLIGDVMLFGKVQAISDSFSVEDIGFVPWAGNKEISFGAGPRIDGNGGSFRRLNVVPGVYAFQSPGSNEMSYGGSVWTDINFRSWGLNLEGDAGCTHEAGTGFFGRSARLSYWSNSLKDNLNFGAGYNHSYNYARGWLADNYSGWLTYTYYFWGRVALMLSANSWWEANPDCDIVGVTSAVRPKVDFRINSKISFNVYSEMVFNTPETRFGETDLASNRVGFLFSWNFRPKSWLYVAVNEYQADYGNGLELADRVAAVKLRYLLYF